MQLKTSNLSFLPPLKIDSDKDKYIRQKGEEKPDSQLGMERKKGGRERKKLSVSKGIESKFFSPKIRKKERT